MEGVERAFDRLLVEWHILDVVARTWFLENVKKIWRACFILHNMIIGDNNYTGYDQDEERVSDENQRREQEIIRKERPLPLLGVGGEVGVDDATTRLENLELSLERLVAGNPDISGVGVEEREWAKFLKRLGHMQDVGINFLKKEKTIEKL